MEVYFNQIIESVKRSITRDINRNDTKVIEMVLAAYNRYQEDERNGVDYLFDITNQSDLKCMVEGGLNVAEIAWAWKKVQDEHISTYFHFGCNYDGLSAAGNLNDLKRKLTSWLDEILPCVLKYVSRCEEYADIYEHYITEYLEKKWDN